MIEANIKLCRNLILILIGLHAPATGHAQNAAPVTEPPIAAEPALDAFTETITMGQLTPDQVLTQAKMMHTLGNHPKASALLRGLIEATQNEHLAAHQLLRRTLIDAQRPDLLPAALLGLSKAYQSQNMSGKALATLQEVQALNPNYPGLSQLFQELSPRDESQVAEVSGFSRFRSLLGIFAFLAIAYLLSSNRKAIRYRIVFWGIRRFRRFRS